MGPARRTLSLEGVRGLPARIEVPLCADAAKATHVVELALFPSRARRWFKWVGMVNDAHAYAYEATDGEFFWRTAQDVTLGINAAHRFIVAHYVTACGCEWSCGVSGHSIAATPWINRAVSGEARIPFREHRREESILAAPARVAVLEPEPEWSGALTTPPTVRDKILHVYMIETWGHEWRTAGPWFDSRGGKNAVTI
jgi:hypothetical protein